MKKVYYADFETTKNKTNTATKVYLWVCLCGNEIFKGYNIESFINFCKGKKIIIYFHNAKFDFSFIEYYLLKNKIFYKILEKKGTIYNAKFFNVEVRDSLNFLPMPLKNVGELYCKNYKKTCIDYEVDYEHIATQQEIDYCINDCKVLEEGLNNYFNSLIDILENVGCEKTLEKIDKKLTNAGIAFESFKELSVFEKACPKTTINEYEHMKKAYKGGFVFSKPCGIIKNVTMIDCNSMYPFIYSEKNLPYGKPKTCESLEECKNFEFYIVTINICYELKKDYIAIIGGGVGKYGNANYKASSNNEYEVLTICNFDFDMIQEYYFCDFVFVSGVGFNTKKNFFKNYCDIFLSIKNSERGIKRNVAKIMLNSPYGKCAMNGKNEIKEYFINEKDIVENNVVGYEFDSESYNYLPIAISICAQARKHLLDTAKKIGFKNVYYMDTDSIKFINDDIDMEFNDNILGAWKFEGKAELFKTIAPKKYCYYESGKIYFTCAGFSKNVLTEVLAHNTEITYENAIKNMNLFDSGLKLHCLQSKKVSGGRILQDTLKEIK